MKKKIIISTGIILILMLTYIFLNRKNNNSEVRENTLNTITLRKGEISKTVSATGKIEPNTIVEIKSKAGGEIIKIPFNEGDTVKRGDLLVELEPSNEERNLLNAQISLEAAEARLSRTKSQYEIEKNNLEKSYRYLKIDYNNLLFRKNDALSKYNRNSELYKKNILSHEELQNSKLSYLSAKSQYDKIKADSEFFHIESERLNIRKTEITDAKISLQRAQISLEDAEDRRKETKIYSPLTGIIIQNFVSEGQIISSGISSVGEGTLLMKIADLSKLYITATVDESDIGSIKEGQRVNISFDAFYNQRYRGRVSRIAPRSQTISNVTVFEIRIEIRDRDLSQLRVGMTANAIVQIAEKEDIFTIPIQAISVRRQKPVVFVERDGEVIPVEITQGITDGINIEIESEELNEGDKIVLSQMPRGSGGNTGRSRDASRDLRRMMR